MSTSVKWEVHLLGFPYSPWIVSEVRELIFSYNLEIRQVGGFNYPIPSNYLVKEIQITYYETHKREVEKFLEEWTKRLKKGFKFLFPEKGALPLKIIKYSNVGKKLTKLSEKNYKVLPNSSLYFEGKSEPQLEQNILNLVVVEDLNED